MRRGETSIDFSTHELLVLSEVAGVPAPAGLGDRSFDDVPPAVRTWIADSVNGSLRARGVLAGDPPRVAEPVAELLQLTGSPPLVIIVTVETDGEGETRYLTISPELAVDHAGIAADVHRLTPFPPREALARALRIADLRPVPSTDLELVQVSFDLLSELGSAALAHERDKMIALIEGTGATSEAARAFTEALIGKRASVSVTVLYKPEPEVVKGGMMVWLDAGMDGLWVIEPVDAGSTDELPSHVELRPTGSIEIAAGLLEFLPDAFSAMAEQPASATGEPSRDNDDQQPPPGPLVAPPDGS